MIGLCAYHSWSDHKSKKVTKIGARLTTLSPKQFSLSIHGMSFISNVSNLTRSSDNIVNVVENDCF